MNLSKDRDAELDNTIKSMIKTVDTSGFHDLHPSDELDDSLNADTKVDEEELQANIDLGKQSEDNKDAKLGNNADANLDNGLR